MNWNIEFSPLLPLPLIATLAAAGMLLVVALAWRRARGVLLRTLTLVLLLLALLNPSLRQEEREPLRDILLVAVDRSASQRLAGREALTDAVRTHLSDRLAGMPELELRWIESPTPGTASNDGTNLFADIGKALADIPPDRLAGIILVTDGRIHDVPESAAELGLEVPVHALLTGRRDEFDRRVEVVVAPRFGLVGSEQMATVKVTEHPARPRGELVELRILYEGQPAQTRRVRIGTEVQIPVRFPHPGTNIVEVDVEAAPGELTTANNKAVLAAEGVRENLRVLLVSGEPHPGERSWRNLLKSDAAVDLVHFTILRPPEKQDGTPINQLSLIAFPTRELFSEKLDEFDLIIFDRYHRRGVLPLLYLDNVARYVREGGAVLVAAGEKYASPTSLYRTPLSLVLPAAPTGNVLEKPFRPGISDTGKRHPVTRGLRGGPSEDKWGRWFRLVDTSSVEGDVLMYGADKKPLLVLNRLDEGRIALLLSDHAWLWARGFEGGGPYTDLLRRLSHWLMKEPDLEEDILRLTGSHSSLTIERRSMQDSVDPVELTGPTGETVRVELEKASPGLWRKTIEAADQGIYRARSGELAAVAHVGQYNAREVSSLTASDEALKPLLEETGGGAFWTGASSGSEPHMPRLVMLRSGRIMHGGDWLGLRHRDAYVVRGVRLIPLFTGIFALALLVGAIAMTWYREGR